MNFVVFHTTKWFYAQWTQSHCIHKTYYGLLESECVCVTSFVFFSHPFYVLHSKFCKFSHFSIVKRCVWFDCLLAWMKTKPETTITAAAAATTKTKIYFDDFSTFFFSITNLSCSRIFSYNIVHTYFSLSIFLVTFHLPYGIVCLAH